MRLLVVPRHGKTQKKARNVTLREVRRARREFTPLDSPDFPVFAMQLLRRGRYDHHRNPRRDLRTPVGIGSFSPAQHREASLGTTYTARTRGRQSPLPTVTSVNLSRHENVVKTGIQSRIMEDSGFEPLTY
jgi:hypothetical protein